MGKDAKMRVLHVKNAKVFLQGSDFVVYPQGGSCLEVHEFHHPLRIQREQGLPINLLMRKQMLRYKQWSYSNSQPRSLGDSLVPRPNPPKRGSGLATLAQKLWSRKSLLFVTNFRLSIAHTTWLPHLPNYEY